jgi:hypothetical protein
MKTIMSTISAICVSILSFAQEKTAEVDINLNKDGGSNWYASPIVWVVGAAVFILLLVAILRGGGRRAD